MRVDNSKILGMIVGELKAVEVFQRKSNQAQIVITKCSCGKVRNIPRSEFLAGKHEDCGRSHGYNYQVGSIHGYLVTTGETYLKDGTRYVPIRCKKCGSNKHMRVSTFARCFHCCTACRLSNVKPGDVSGRGKGQVKALKVTTKKDKIVIFGQCKCGDRVQWDARRFRSTFRCSKCAIKARELKAAGVINDRGHIDTFSSFVSMQKNNLYVDWPYNQSGYDQFVVDLGIRVEGKILGRFDKTKPFSKSNCFWGSHKEVCQARSSKIKSFKQATEIRVLGAQGMTPIQISVLLFKSEKFRSTVGNVLHNNSWRVADPHSIPVSNRGA